MGLLYEIYQSMQERDKHTTELMDSSRSKDEDEASEHPKSLIELLSEPIGNED
jgi:hypothetical protein